MSAVTCQCGQTYPLLPNVHLRRTAGLGLAEMSCPWCGHRLTVRLDRPRWSAWDAGVTSWRADVGVAVGMLRLAFDVAGDLAAEMIGQSRG